MDKKSDDSSEDEYYGATQKGFDFNADYDWGPFDNTKLPSSGTGRDDLNILGAKSCGGLREVAENKTSCVDALSPYFLNEKDELQAKKVGRRCSPLEIVVKEIQVKKLTTTQTIRNVVFGLDYSFQHFRSTKDKHNLLLAAVKSHDGNAILMVVMFLKSTLKKSLFHRTIGVFPAAVNMYLSHLREMHEIDELTNMLLMLRKTDEAAMLKYDVTVLMQSPDRRQKLLQNCLNTHFQPDSVHPSLRKTVLEHKQCLENHTALMDHKIHVKVNETNDKLFEELTGSDELFDSSAMAAVIYASLHFPYVPQVAPISAEVLKCQNQFTMKESKWANLRVYAALEKWSDIDEMIFKKSWLPKHFVQKRVTIEPTRILEVLSKVKAPIEVMERYVMAHSDRNQKIFFAKKYKCHTIVFGLLTKNRDRLGIIEYKDTLPAHSEEFCTATDILNNKSIKWKN